MENFFAAGLYLAWPQEQRHRLLGAWGQGPLSGFVGSDHITYNSPAEWAVTTTLAPPLLDGTFIAHAHVSTHVQYTVNGTFTANSAFSSTTSCRCRCIYPLLHCCCWIQCRIGCCWYRLWIERSNEWSNWQNSILAMKTPNSVTCCQVWQFKIILWHTQSDNYIMRLILFWPR